MVYPTCLDVCACHPIEKHRATSVEYSRELGAALCVVVELSFSMRSATHGD